MPHSNIEYAIMAPILLLQVLFLPVATAWMMDYWGAKRMETTLQDVASHLGTTVQQLYYSLNRDDVLPGEVTQTLNVPEYIESTPYTITTSSLKIENSTAIDLHLALLHHEVTARVRTVLGSNARLSPSSFTSNSTATHLSVEKFANGTIHFSFGAG
jgi:hypothetical protein